VSIQVIEGTWEEVKRHEAELIGRQVRLIIKPYKPTTHKPKAQKTAQTEPKILRARGMLAGILSTEEYFREKREDTAREDRSL
jgi:hypothetical protein